jgi:hypothetical protein
MARRFRTARIASRQNDPERRLREIVPRRASVAGLPPAARAGRCARTRQSSLGALANGPGEEE